MFKARYTVTPWCYRLYIHYCFNYRGLTMQSAYENVVQCGARRTGSAVTVVSLYKSACDSSLPWLS